MVENEDRTSTDANGTEIGGAVIDDTGADGAATLEVSGEAQQQSGQQPSERAPRRRRVFERKAAVPASGDGPLDALPVETPPVGQLPLEAPPVEPAALDGDGSEIAEQLHSQADDPEAPQAEAAAPARVRRPGLELLFQAPPPPPAPTPAGDAPRGAARPPAAAAEVADDESVEDEDGDPSGVSRRSRRRSRRRTGAAGAEGAPEVVAKAKPAPEPITEPQRIKGSTRLEAKRQRRRDGRDAGRRRTVVTESEFLARREAVDRVMLVHGAGDRVEIGVLEDGVLVEHYVAKSQNVSLIGNVYLGRVQNVLPSMEAAFVDIGRGRNAVLYSGEVDWEAASDRIGDKGSQARRIELALKSGDRVLVQVTKDPIGHKGARLTSAVSLPGRYLVYVPNGSMSGISRKLPDTERTRLKKILKDALPDSAGVIVRTAAEGASEEQLTIDVQRLANQWAEISRIVETATAPAMLHSEPDLLVKIVRDVFNEDFTKMVIDGADARATIERYLGQVAPDLLERVEPWAGKGDVFAAHRVTEQIEKALDRKVWLPSGGSLVIDRTEAMTVIDVNTGKFVGSGGNLEETVTRNNLEAAEEIVRQLRLRDIGGIIVIDFIDMVLENNRDLVSRRLVECLSRDRTKHQVAEVTSLGLVQMTRKRLGLGLAESVTGEDVPADRVEAQPGRRRRGGGGGPAQVQPQQQAVPRTPATHTITDEAKTRLAQIAGATITTKPQDAGPVAPAALAEAPLEVPIVDASAVEVLVEEVRVTADPVSIELPEPQAPLHDVVPVAEAAQLLDAVLDHLPAPSQPGQGRRRSRRVTTPALTPGES